MMMTFDGAFFFAEFMTSQTARVFNPGWAITGEIIGDFLLLGAIA